MASENVEGFSVQVVFDLSAKLSIAVVAMEFQIRSPTLEVVAPKR
jgi:hypothetical protein